MMNNKRLQPRGAQSGRHALRRTLTKWVAAIVLLLGVAWSAFLVRTWYAERPRPTVAGWQAVVKTHAGDGAPGFQDGAASAQARFADPFGIAVDRFGNVYVADAGNSNRIRKINADGYVSTFAGEAEGYADGVGAAASFNTPSALALDLDGNFYVADTANNRIRKITPDGNVTTLAGDGTAGYADGAATTAQFNAPVGIAVDVQRNVYIADTYNDRIRQITPDGQVKTLAGGASPGYADGAGINALFDTPCALAAAATGELFIADTGNRRIRKLTPDGQVTTLPVVFANEGDATRTLDTPLGIALTHDGFLYVTEANGGRIVQIAPDATARVLAGAGSGFADGGASEARFNNPAGIAVDRHGALFIADGSNYLVRRVAPAQDANEADKKDVGARVASEVDEARTANDGARTENGVVVAAVPRLTVEMLGVSQFPWPVDPQQQWHEVVATMGEVRGSFDGESRHHLHSGIDVPGAQGATVRAVYDEKVASPLANWGFGGLNEGMRVGLMTYIHMRVGRSQQDEPLGATAFDVLRNAEGKAERVRVKRGTRFRVGDALGTINRMYHVHLNFGPGAAEANPLMLPFVGFTDRVAPTIERDGIQLIDTSGRRFDARRAGRLVVRGDVSVVVDAYDQVDRNQSRRRLGLYTLGYQLLKPDGTPAPNFAEPRITIRFDRLPPEREAVKIAYADASGITVYGSAATKFLYVVTNKVIDGRATQEFWRTSETPPGDYVLRIIAADFAGNEATEGRDVPVTIERE
ncbi:MAG TPA: NHL repeat-containing protein [Pyrinomonadaceae bacterium]|jgi:sugar lactone lactonase YvrE